MGTKEKERQQQKQGQIKRIGSNPEVKKREKKKQQKEIHNQSKRD